MRAQALSVCVDGRYFHGCCNWEWHSPVRKMYQSNWHSVWNASCVDRRWNNVAVSGSLLSVWMSGRPVGVCLCVKKQSVYVIKHIICVEVSGRPLVMQTAEGAPLCNHRPLHNSVSLRYVNNWSSHVIFLKVVAFRGKQTHSSCCYTALSCQAFSPPSLPLFLQHASVGY